MTGGGPGLMEAANRGAREAGGRSVACSIKLSAEEQMNPYLDHSVVVRYFFVRKVLLFQVLVRVRRPTGWLRHDG